MFKFSTLMLKKVSDTKRASRESVVEAILQNLPTIKRTLERIINGEVQNS